MAERLRLPASIFINHHDDPVRERYLQNQRAPSLVRGYRLIEVEDESIQAIINEHVEDLADTMSALLSLLPPRVIVAAFAFGTEPEWLPERSRETVRAVLRSFGTAIAEDPNLELIVMPMDQSLPQLHLANGKVLVMTAPSSSLASFRAALAALRMPEVQNLATIDEFPRAIGYPLGATAKLVGELRQTIQSIAYLTRTQDPLSERKRSGGRFYGMTGSGTAP